MQSKHIDQADPSYEETDCSHNEVLLLQNTTFVVRLA